MQAAEIVGPPLSKVLGNWAIDLPLEPGTGANLTLCKAECLMRFD